MVEDAARHRPGVRVLDPAHVRYELRPPAPFPHDPAQRDRRLGGGGGGAPRLAVVQQLVQRKCGRAQHRRSPDLARVEDPYGDGRLVRRQGGEIPVFHVVEAKLDALVVPGVAVRVLGRGRLADDRAAPRHLDEGGLGQVRYFEQPEHDASR